MLRSRTRASRSTGAAASEEPAACLAPIHLSVSKEVEAMTGQLEERDSPANDLPNEVDPGGCCLWFEAFESYAGSGDVWRGCKIAARGSAVKIGTRNVEQARLGSQQNAFNKERTKRGARVRW